MTKQHFSSALPTLLCAALVRMRTKSISLLLLAVILQSIGFSARAQDGDCYEFAVTGFHVYDKCELTQGPVTVSGTALQAYYCLSQIYPLTISSTGGNIGRVVFETLEGTLEANASTGTFNANALAWTGSATSINFTYASSTEYHIGKIKVYLGGSTPDPITKTYTVEIKDNPSPAYLIYGDKQYASGASFTATGLVASSLAATPISGYNYNISISDGNVIRVAYFEQFPKEGVPYLIQEISGGLYLNVFCNTADRTKDVVLTDDPQVFYFTADGNSYYIQDENGLYIGKSNLNTWGMNADTKQLWTVEAVTGGYAFHCTQGYIGFDDWTTGGTASAAFRDKDYTADHGIFAITPTTIGPTELTLKDGEAYKAVRAKHYDTLTYTRNFSDKNWQALYVPFSISYEEWKDKYDIARICNFIDYDDNDDGTFDRTYLVIQKKTSGYTEPNHPYLIRAKEAGEQTLVMTNKTLQPATGNSINCFSVDYDFNFYGTYESMKNMKTNGYFAMSGGSLKQAKNDDIVLNAQRWYMEMVPRTGEYKARHQEISILVEGEETTSIEGPRTTDNGQQTPTYDLQGRRLQASPLKADGLSGISRGSSLYIQGGKKIIK